MNSIETLPRILELNEFPSHVFAIRMYVTFKGYLCLAYVDYCDPKLKLISITIEPNSESYFPTPENGMIGTVKNLDDAVVMMKTCLKIYYNMENYNI